MRAKQNTHSPSISNVSSNNRLIRLFRAWAVILFLTLAAYSNSFSTGLLFDSKVVITEDPRLQAWEWPRIRDILLDDYWHGRESNLYRPLTTLSYAVQYSLCGHRDQPMPYHTVNLFLHIGVGILLFHLLRRMGLALFPATAATLFFTLHPLTVEGVTNVVGRADVLCAGGILIALHGRLFLCGHQTKNRFWTACFLVTTGAFISVGSKESGVTLIGLLILFDLIFVWSQPASDEGKEKSTTFSKRSLLCLYAISLCVAGIWFYFRHLATLTGIDPVLAGDNPILTLKQPWAFLTASTILLRYLILIIWPAELSADYSFDAIPMVEVDTGATMIAQGLGAVVFLSAVVGAAGYYRRRAPRVAFFTLFFFVTIAPVSNIFIRIGTIMAERLLYIPLIGVAGLCACGLQWAWSRTNPPVRRWIPATAIVIVLTLASRTWWRNRDWVDMPSLFRSAVSVVPDSFKANSLYAANVWLEAATEEEREKVIDQILPYAERSVEIMKQLPESGWSHSPLGNLIEFYMFKMDTTEEPETAIWRQRALELCYLSLEAEEAILKRTGGDSASSGNFIFHLQMGKLLLHEGKMEEGMEELQTAIRLHPAPPALLSASAALREIGRTKDAMLWALAAFTLDQTSDSVFEQLDISAEELNLVEAIPPGQGQRAVYIDHPSLRPLLDTACAKFYRLLREAGHSDFAKRYRLLAVDSLGCPAEQFPQ